MRSLTASALCLLVLSACSGQSTPVAAAGGAGSVVAAGGGAAGQGGTPEAKAGASGAGGVMSGVSGGGGAPAGGSGGAASDAPSVTVSAGEIDRHQAITTFKLASVAGKSFALEGAQGESLPLQVASDGSAVFVLPELPKGQERTYQLKSSDAEPAQAVTSVHGTDDVSLAVGATKVLRFQAQGKLPAGVNSVYLRGGYIHPLFSPMGRVVTDDYPASHIHHHGIWSAWTRATFNGHALDFWNMADRLAKVDFKTLGTLWQGPVHAGFEADLDHIDLVGPQPVTALTEHWKVTAYKTHAEPLPYLVFDLESVQRAATAMPVELEEYIYGGFGVRGAGEWLDKSKVTFLTSEGKDRLAGDATSGRWLYIGGTVGGGQAGFAVLGHPSNFRAPQPLRLHPDEPYASLSPPKSGAFSIQPGTDYVTRFRIVSVDGPPDAALFDRLWNDYATPPATHVN
jgi:Methane oxygenase PmoA